MQVEGGGEGELLVFRKDGDEKRSGPRRYEGKRTGQ